MGSRSLLGLPLALLLSIRRKPRNRSSGTDGFKTGFFETS